MASSMLRTTLQAACLSALSNTLAQLITAYRANLPPRINPTPLFHFVLSALITTPPNILWQSLLESSFPSNPRARRIEHTRRTARADSPAEERWEEKVVTEKRFSKRNAAIKWGLDQTIGALVNTVGFLALVAGLEGAGWEEVKGRIATHTWPLMKAGYKVWPLVSLLSFTVIPVQSRVIFGGAVGVAWGVFLSLFTQK